MHTSKRKKIFLINLIVLSLIVLFGSYLRIEAIVETYVPDPLQHDARDYFMYAYNMRHNQIYSKEIVTPDNSNHNITPDAVRSPGYPLFLSFFTGGLPNRIMINNIIFTQMIISILTLYFAYQFFKNFLLKFWGAIAAFLVAICPHLIIANIYILTETLFCFFIVILGCLFCKFIFNPSNWRACLIGAIIGICSLVRPGLQYLPVFMIFFFLFHYGKKRGGLFFLVMMIGFIIIYSPWTIRNIITLKATSDKTLMINFLHHGIYPDFTYDKVQESFGFPYKFDPRSKEIRNNTASVLKEICKRFKEEPARHLYWYIIKKPAAFWSWNIINGAGDIYVYYVSKTPYNDKSKFEYTYRLMNVLHWRIVLLSIVGSLLVWVPASFINVPAKSILCARYCALFLLYFTIMHMIGTPFPRYSIPLRPYLFGMALFTLYFLFSACKTLWNIKNNS